MATILIVEDEPSLRDLATIILQRGGHTVIACADATNAVITLLQERVDLIVLDLVMPEMDGFALTRALRDHARWAHTPILAVTALGGRRYVDEMREAGMDGVIHKPFRARDLLGAVDSLLHLDNPVSA